MAETQTEPGTVQQTGCGVEDRRYERVQELLTDGLHNFPRDSAPYRASYREDWVQLPKTSISWAEVGYNFKIPGFWRQLPLPHVWVPGWSQHDISFDARGVRGHNRRVLKRGHTMPYYYRRLEEDQRRVLRAMELPPLLGSLGWETYRPEVPKTRRLHLLQLQGLPLYHIDGLGGCRLQIYVG